LMEERALTIMHELRVQGGTVIVPDQVEQAVDRQKVKLLLEGVPQPAGLSLGGLPRDHHLAEKRNRPLLIEGKCEHISSFLFAEESGIQAFHPAVVHIGKMHFRARAPQGPKRTPAGALETFQRKSSPRRKASDQHSWHYSLRGEPP